MSLLNQIRPPHGAVKNRKRLGRGESSGLGKTSGRGHKGQKARAGGYHKVGFEGGQMPLARRLPKRGFSNVAFSSSFAVINVSQLNRLPQDVTEVDADALVARGVIRRKLDGLKILGDGELTRALTITAAKFSKTAQAKIEKAGGKAVVAA